MKKLTILSLLTITAVITNAAEVKVQNFRAGEIQIESFGIMDLPDLTGSPEWGVGVGVGYYITRGLGVSIQGISYAQDEWGGAVVDQGNLRVNFRAPLWDRVAPTAYVQGIHNFDRSEWGAGAGGGLELRFTKNIGIFGETGVDITTEGRNNWTTKAGFRFSF